MTQIAQILENRQSAERGPDSSTARDGQTYAIIGAAMAVHTELGSGFLEAVYQEALAWEFRRRSIPFEREQRLPVYYRGELLNAHYEADFVCYGSVIVELKALARLGGNEQAQLLNYLKAARLHRGLLINFGAKSLEYKRFVHDLRQPAQPTDQSDSPQSA